MGDNIAFPWHEYVPATRILCRYLVRQPCSTTKSQQEVDLGSAWQENKMTQDPQGVGPPQHWYVPGGSTAPFHFEFGVKG